MRWGAYTVVWRLKAPLHAGRGKVGNLQLTRPYVTGRMIWGALTARLARIDAARASRPAVEAADYQEADAHHSLRFSYFFPALWEKDRLVPAWPAADETRFRYRFLGSYASTALDYGRQGALDGSLHEVEFIMPNTRPVDPGDESQPVYLTGVLFVRKGTGDNWQQAISRLQLGGERGYGWGWVERTGQDRKPDPAADLFGYEWELDGNEPTITVPAGKPLLAHTVARGLQARGEIEPLVGREWSDGKEGKGTGQRVVFTNVCYAPGATVTQETRFTIGRCGVWQKL